MSLRFIATTLLVANIVAFSVPLRQRRHLTASSSCCFMTRASTDNKKSLVVISPPGGVGEVVAVKAASMGSMVRWFVVSLSANQNVLLSQTALDDIANAGGSVEFAGSDAESLLLSKEDPKSSIAAMSKWCGQADGIACALSGIEEHTAMMDGDPDLPTLLKTAICSAAKEAAPAVSGPKVAILSAFEDEEESSTNESSGGIGNIVGPLFRGPAPTSLTEALGSDASKVLILRHGEIFGSPESSPDFSPLVGGPQKNPEICEEYRTRSVRIDPLLSSTGNVMMGKNTRSSCHSVGEAAALILLGHVPGANVDFCISSQLGAEPVAMDVWKNEFQRAEKVLQSSEGAQLFSASFSSVPNTERLADWLAFKWAPAVLRTYEITTIRTGARPVYAKRAGDGQVEIIWQELVDFNSVTVGRILIHVSDTELVATRAPGDATAGFGSISPKPLNGENVFVLRLADAASQAVEKELAEKSPSKVAEKEPVAAAPAVTTSGAIEIRPTPATAEAGPRQTGARRSKEKARGTRRRKSSSSKSEKLN